MAIALVAYPNMSDEHYQWIEGIRHKHPELDYTPLDPHFTLVFPLTGTINQESLVQHIDHLIQQATPISFTIRCAIPVPEIDKYYAFLVPDEGFSRLVRLHDALYTDILSEHLNLDMPYVPHITIGHSDNAQIVKQISMSINRQNIDISGIVDMLALMDNKNGKWNCVQDFALTG